MPTVIEEGEYKFIVHTQGLPYEPPHVHVRFGGEEVRINLDSGRFMERPPGGKGGKIMDISPKKRGDHKEGVGQDPPKLGRDQLL